MQHWASSHHFFTMFETAKASALSFLWMIHDDSHGTCLESSESVCLRPRSNRSKIRYIPLLWLWRAWSWSNVSATKFSCVNEKALCPPEGSAWCSLVCQIPKHTKGGFTCTKIKICQFWCPSARARSPKLVPVIFIIWEPGIDCNLIGAFLTRNTASLHCETATSYTLAKVFQEHVSQLAGFLKYYGRFLHGAEIRITWVADSRVFDLIMWTKRK